MLANDSRMSPAALVQRMTLSRKDKMIIAQRVRSLLAWIAFSQFWTYLAGAEAGERVRLGLLLPPEEPQAVSLREGVLLAEEQASMATGQVEVVIRGRVGQWGADAVEAARMITDDGVAGLIAPPDGAASHLALQVSGRTAAPVVSLCADSSISRTGVPWVLRVVPRTTEEATGFFTSIPARVAGKTNHWVALVPDGRAGRELSGDLKAASLACNCPLDKTLQVSSATTNSDLILAQALSSRPEAVLIWLAPVSAGRMAKNLRGAGYTGTLAGPGRLRCADFVNAAGQALEGFVLSGLVLDGQSAARRCLFEDAFQRRWGHEPGWMAEMSYDAAMLLAHLMRQHRFEAPPHRLAPDFFWPGVTGEIGFDEEGNRKVELQLLAAHQGRFVPTTVGIRGIRTGIQAFRDAN